jgi:hypothetical protein
MAVKKKAELGPKAKLMKKNLTQLKAQAKRLKIKGFSTKKKDALVKSIMMAEARKQKSKAPKKSMGASGSMKRIVKKRGAMPNRVMKNPVRPGARKLKSITRKPMMSEYNGWTNYETWLTNMYFEQTFQMFIEEAAENPGGAYLPEDAYELGEVYKDLVEEMNYEVLQGEGTYFITDIVNAAMREVNWTEIARHYIE